MLNAASVAVPASERCRNLGMNVFMGGENGDGDDGGAFSRRSQGKRRSPRRYVS